eukprot:scaffold67376_cov31-Tisochrysis_lutea.AAC.4
MAPRRAPLPLSPSRAALALVLCSACAGVRGFYLPGVAPHEYQDNERVEIKVNKLSSTKTQLPYDYYSLPFCRPLKVIDKVENLGEVLHGSRIQVLGARARARAP